MVVIALRLAAATCLTGALAVWPPTVSAQTPEPTPPAEVHEHVVVDGTMLAPTLEPA